MIRLMALGVVGIAVSGCALRTPYLAAPTVDMRSVNQNRYNTDLSDCQNLKIQRNKDTIWTDGIISDCMAARGCKILPGAVSG
jgi:hypothetical protein